MYVCMYVVTGSKLGISPILVVVQVGLRVPTPLAEKRSASSEPGLQEVANTGSVHRHPGLTRCA